MKAPNLYKLLPAVYRLRDDDNSLHFKALIEIINREIGIVQDDIELLYKNWFIETCEPWVVPYLGQLVGIEPEPGTSFIPQVNPRSGIGDAIRFRRRRGTLHVIEEVANDLRFPARAVELEKLCQQTPTAEFLRPEVGQLIDFRSFPDMQELGSPFELAANLPDFRTPSSSERIGWYHPANIGLFVWRNQSLPLRRVMPKCIAAREVETQKGRKQTLCIYTFDPSGEQRQLFVSPSKEESEFGIAQKENLPIPMTRSMLLEDRIPLKPTAADADGDWIIDSNEKPLGLNTARADTDSGGAFDGLEFWVDGTDPVNQYDDVQYRYYGIDRSVCIYRKTQDAVRLVSAHEILSIDLSKLIPLAQPCSCKSACQCRKVCDEFACELARSLTNSKLRHNVAIDPELGVFAFVFDSSCSARSENTFLVSFHESRPMPIGGGQYERIQKRYATYSKPRMVTHELSDGNTLEQIVERYQGPDGQVSAELIGNQTLGIFKHSNTNLRVTKPFVEIRAANGFRPFFSSPSHQCTERGTVEIQGGSTLVIDGLVIANQLKIRGVERKGDDSASNKKCEGRTNRRLTRIIIRHSTIGELPKLGKGLLICGGIDVVIVENSIIGPIEVRSHMDRNSKPSGITRLILRDTIVAGEWPSTSSEKRTDSLSGRERLQIELMERCTIFGKTDVFRVRKAVDSIFNGAVHVERNVHNDETKEFDQFRYCYLRPDGWVGDAPIYSILPDRHRCQPELATKRQQDAECKSDCLSSDSILSPSIPGVPRNIYPHFMDRQDPLQHGYAQLTAKTPDEIFAGSEKGSEMGAFSSSFYSNRIRCLKSRLEKHFQPIGKQLIVINADSLE